MLTCFKLGLARQDGLSSSSPALPPEAVDEVHRNIERIPDRQILDFLVQFFVGEVNWFVLRQIHHNSFVKFYFEPPMLLKARLTPSFGQAGPIDTRSLVPRKV